MRVYRLDPIDDTLEDPTWQASAIRGVGCWVRAESEKEARRDVIHVSVIGITRQPGEAIRISPWSDPSFTTCVEDRPGFEVPEGVVVTTDGRRLVIS